jgi:hypothetical protein
MLRASDGPVPRQRLRLRDRTRNAREKQIPLTYHPDAALDATASASCSDAVVRLTSALVISISPCPRL